MKGSNIVLCRAVWRSICFFGVANAAAFNHTKYSYELKTGRRIIGRQQIIRLELQSQGLENRGSEEFTSQN